MWRIEQLENWRWKVKYPTTNRFCRHLAWAETVSSNKGNIPLKFHRILYCCSSHIYNNLILHMGNTRPSCMCVIKEKQYYTNRLSQYHGCCQYHEFMSIPWLQSKPCSLSIPWVPVYTMSRFLYHESFSIPWVHVCTMSPCLYHETMCILWVLANYMHPCLYHESLPMT